MITQEEYAYFVDRALDGMATVLTDLGDERANSKPDLPGANTPFAIVAHCLGVLDFWAGKLVAGREVDRDRDAEFTATGNVADLVARIETAKRQLREDVALADPGAPLLAEPHGDYRHTPIGASQGAALQHVFEELAQHHGQLELTRDVLLAGA